MIISDNERQVLLLLRYKLSSRIIVWRTPVEEIRFKGVETPGGVFVAPKAKGKMRLVLKFLFIFPFLNDLKIT
jgi:hypothetical protein